MTPSALPAWLPLLRKPYEDSLGSRTAWQIAQPGGAPVHVERAGRGLYNLLYRVTVDGETFACKLFIVDERQRAEREWAALQAVAVAGLEFAPMPIAFAPAGPLPQPAIISLWLDGVSLAQQAPGPGDVLQLIQASAAVYGVTATGGQKFLPAYRQPPGYAAYLAESEELLGKVQAWAGAAGRSRTGLPGWAKVVAERLPLCEQALARAQQAVAAATSDGRCRCPGLIRADGGLENVLRVAGGRLVFIDWSTSGQGDPAYDLATLRWHPQAMKVPARDWSQALAAYPPPPDDLDFCERRAVYNQLVPAWWLARSAVHLLEGAGQLKGQARLVSVPARLYRNIRIQLDQYLAALDLIAPPEDREQGDD